MSVSCIYKSKAKALLPNNTKCHTGKWCFSFIYFWGRERRFPAANTGCTLFPVWSASTMSMLRMAQKGFDAIDPYGITIVVIDREMMLQLHRIIGVGNADSLLQTWFALFSRYGLLGLCRCWGGLKKGSTQSTPTAFRYLFLTGKWCFSFIS